MGTLTDALTRDGSIRVLLEDSTDIVREARLIHRTSKTASAALGRSLTAASLMCSTLKNETDSLTLQIKGDGPLGSIVCVGESGGNVRGYVAHPTAELPLNENGKLDVGKAVGKGLLYVIRDTGTKEPYVGICELATSEIAVDIAEYYAKSEQIPTVCALGVRVDDEFDIVSAGGFLLQLMPFADQSLIPAIEENIQAMESISLLIAKNTGNKEILDQILKGMEYDILSEHETRYECTCSKERFASGIVSLGKNDIQEMIDEGKPVETRCHFCNKAYEFTPQELKELYNNASADQ
ncbi:MAG: Hsp33 family molecular chaperone HslO [Eubacteriaceae bacterium]|nr:Hsp33 family molecular chaperone HslO [Eubacteriaceae bacterium]